MRVFCVTGSYVLHIENPATVQFHTTPPSLHTSKKKDIKKTGRYNILRETSRIGTTYLGGKDWGEQLDRLTQDTYKMQDIGRNSDMSVKNVSGERTERKR